MLINCMSTISALQMLSLKDEYTLSLSHFLITGLCDYFATCCSNITLLLIASPEGFAAVLTACVAKFYPKNVQTTELIPSSYPSYFEFL